MANASSAIWVDVFNHDGEIVTAEVHLTPRELKKVADVTLHFDGGFLADMKLAGFSVWRKFDGGWSVTFPQHTWVERGSKQRFTFLRPENEKSRLGWEPIEQAVMNAVRKAQEAEIVSRVAPEGVLAAEEPKDGEQ